MLDIDKVKECYNQYSDGLEYYQKIDEYYYGNTDELKKVHKDKNRSNVKIVDNFVQLFVDQEAQYSFGNKITYSYKDDIDKNISDIIGDNTFNKANHDSSLGQRLIEFGLVYELNFISKEGFKSKIITPLNGNVYMNAYDEVELFIYVHDTNIDVYDDTNVYYLNSSFSEIKESKKHGFNFVPVGVGMIGGNRYSIKRGYIEGDKTIFRTIKSNQDAYSQTKSCMTQEIIDFRNAILKTYGIKLRDKTDEDGNVILDKHGRPLKDEPVLPNTKMLHFKNKKESDAEWLTKNINDGFIQNMLKVYRDDMHTLTCHTDCNEKMQSNLSGQALRARLQALESKCTSNIYAMTDIISTRLKCLFDYLKSIRIGEYNYKRVNIEFTVCVPIDDASVADMISKLAPTGVVSKETMSGWLPKISNIEAEKEKVKAEKKEELDNFPDINLGGSHENE